MNKEGLKSFVNNLYFFPVLVGLWGVFYFLFGEKIPANNGLGWDGFRYADILKNLLHSKEIDSYTAMRVYPSFLLRSFYSIFNIELSDQNIVRGFELLNVLSVFFTVFFIKKIFIHLKLKFETQILGFILLIFNYAFLKHTFFYPVLTDLTALCLSTMLLYFWLKNETINMIIIILIGAFTWPILFYQGLLLIVFPVEQKEPVYVNKWFRILFSVVSLVFASALIYYFIFKQKLDAPYLFTLKIDRDLLMLSITGVLMIYYFLPFIFFDKRLFQFSEIKNKIHLNRLLVIAVLYVFFHIGVRTFNLKNTDSSDFTVEHVLSTPIIYSHVKPLISLVTQCSFYGLIIVFLILFWRKFIKSVQSFGLGITLAFALNLYLCALISEARILINLLPWIVVFLMPVFDKYKLSSGILFLIFVLNFIISKVWLTIHYDFFNNPYNTDGTIGFPNQKYYMHTGVWMTEGMWKLQFVLMLLVFIISFFVFYKINFNSKKKIVLRPLIFKL